jgi:TetR/AcrR family transcriptional repressor of mexJK operon
MDFGYCPRQALRHDPVLSVRKIRLYCPFRHKNEKPSLFPNQENQTADNRTRILNAAAEAFMEKGYRASIDDIAARAGVVKQTLYNHFERKDLLFHEVIRNAIQAVLVSLEVDGLELRETLIRFALAFRGKTLSPEGLAMFRAIVAEAPRFPELATSFFSAGPAQALGTLAAFLGKAMDAGKLRRDDPRFAAEILLGMLTSHDRLRGLINLESDLNQDVAKIEKIIDCFLLAYGK